MLQYQKIADRTAQPLPGAPLARHLPAIAAGISQIWTNEPNKQKTNKHDGLQYLPSEVVNRLLYFRLNTFVSLYTNKDLEETVNIADPTNFC